MRRYHDHLMEELKDSGFAAGYLNTVLTEGDPKMFWIALKNVAEARGGMVKLARMAKLNRGNLYRIFTEHRNPEVQTLTQILSSLGLRLNVVPEKHHHMKHAA